MRRLVALALAAFIALAGCMRPGAEEPVDAQSEASAETNVSREALPDERGGEFAAFNETNATEEGVGGIDHRHDYWQGRDRVAIIEEDVHMFSCCYTTKPGARSGFFEIEPGALVYEGTGKVVVTLSEPVRRSCGAVITMFDGDGPVCTDRYAPIDDPAGGPAGLHLLVRDAMGTELVDMGEIGWNAPFEIKITDARQTDMPHATNTLWDFEFASDDMTLSTIRFHLLIEVVREGDREIPQWPGHPEFYADVTERLVLDLQDATTVEDGPNTLIDPNAPRPAYHAPEKLVSWGTHTLHVYANITDVRTDNPALTPGAWALRWHNASGGIDEESLDEHTGAVRELSWKLRVDNGSMDNPYAPSSRWGFQVVGYFNVGAEPADIWFSCSGFCASYEIVYDLKVVASSIPLPKDEDGVDGN